MILVLLNHQHTLKMGTDLFPETSENLHILTLLCDPRKFMNLGKYKSIPGQDLWAPET